MGNLSSSLRSEIESSENVPPPLQFGEGLSPSLATSLQKPIKDWEGYVKDLPAIMDAFIDTLHGGPGQNDRLLLLEKLITWMANHPGSHLAQRFEQKVIDILFCDLPHPAVGFLCLPHNIKSTPTIQHKEISYAYRTADGSNYNILMPHLGQAGMPYARTVPSTHPLPATFLPDPSLVFDVLLKRDGFKKHPGGVSSLFFAFADLVIHSLFNTSRDHPNINNSSSYLDLSPLYGSSDAQVDSVRRKDGTGRLYEDVFADSRLLVMPPSACALLILLCRNHNYIADKLLSINENGNFKAPSELDEKAKQAQDEELFQRSRLVNCGFFMQIILADYVGAILGLVRDGKDWRLKVLNSMRRFDHTLSPRGEGNAVSVEFNLMYRWHATLSEPDAAWITNEFQQIFPDKDLSTLTPDDLKKGYRRMAPPKDTREWAFGGLKRGEDGRYNNGDLAGILQSATETYASAFKARGIPEALKVVEMMGIQQSRSWGTCSLNEFRKFMGLKPYNSFQEWNPDPDISKAAEALYHDVDNLELYVGMQAEETKLPTPGAGLCPGYTISRAILADAVCLTRGDRFMTLDFTPANFTSWGYQDCQVPTNDGSYGGMLTKLLFRTLPEYYSPWSAHAHFPFMVPEAMKEAMEKRNDPAVGSYEWTRPAPKTPVLPPAVNGHANGSAEPNGSAVPNGNAVTNGSATVGPGGELERVWQERLIRIVGHDYHRQPIEDLVLSESLQGSFAKITGDLIEAKSVTAVGSNVKHINAARDVVNEVTRVWISEILGSSLQADYESLADYIYINSMPEEECVLFNRAKVVAQKTAFRIDQVIRGLTDAMSGGFDVMSPTGTPHTPSESQFVLALRTRLASTGRTPEDFAFDFLGDIVATAPLFSRTIVRVLDYMFEDLEHARAIFNAYGSFEADAALLTYIGKALDVVDDIGIHVGLMNNKFLEQAGVAILKTIFACKDVKRSAGRSGELTSLTGSPTATTKVAYLNAFGEVTPWPQSLMLQYTS